MSTPHEVAASTATVPCTGCGAQVPDVDGPTHAYLSASPGCWQRYGEVATSLLAGAGDTAARWCHVDCYAAQHPGGAEHDRRQRQSVAVHLTALCLLVHHGVPANRVAALRGRLSQTVLPRLGLADWPYLTPPTTPGTVTVAEVHAAHQDDRVAVGERWLGAVWSAWSAHHRTVQEWAQAALGGRG
ncbi:DUF5946 family protein [Goodfellowiella coeruleoviolacea]|uniref:Uncharacterized protein n=1 Tax=Goodfellowiella coeruleoviolacea TaxID=334858 RepID=A0AAE3KLF2_9PSEU|nr:DUF5946 family protein [Goodfellowiella coeruleoviolacea]MCP2166478.1 hypothetical protein [Goodfellowiella coeruleoviolacea]